MDAETEAFLASMRAYERDAGFNPRLATYALIERCREEARRQAAARLAAEEG